MWLSGGDQGTRPLSQTHAAQPIRIETTSKVVSILIGYEFKMMKRTISSPFVTFVFKFIFSTLWIGGFGLGTIMLFVSGQDGKWSFLIAWIIGAFFIYNFCVKLKLVEIDDNCVHISNYVKKTSLRLSEIDEIRENLFINLHPILIKFKNDTIFGNKILFTPKGSYIFRRHPIVQELRDMVQKSKNVS
jgi:hypothetical protein